jgi:hypothetical protein
MAVPPPSWLDEHPMTVRIPTPARSVTSPARLEVRREVERDPVIEADGCTG